MLLVIGSVFVGIIIVLLLIALVLPKNYSIVSEIVILKPKSVVYPYLIMIKNQEKYSKWVMADPNVKLTYTGTDGTVGFKAAWTSEQKDVGVGEQEIKKITEKGYEVEIRFEKPFKGVSQAVTEAQAVSTNETRVTTTFITYTPFPMNLMVPIVKNILKKDMDGNGERLKRNIEGL